MPGFDARACGCPKDWNEKAKVMYWDKDTIKRYFPRSESTARADVPRFAKVLEKRMLKNGRSVLVFVGESHNLGDALSRFPWKAFSGTESGSESKSKLAYENDMKSDWKKPWHGFKPEAFCPTMSHGKLRASRDTEGGDILFLNAPGVYVFASDKKEKAWGYARCVPLGDGGGGRDGRHAGRSA